VKEFHHVDSITPIQRARRFTPCCSEGKDYASQFIEVCYGRFHCGDRNRRAGARKVDTQRKGKGRRQLSTRDVKAERQRALDAYGSVRRSPTFGAPNPNHPAFTGGGSTGYNANLYVY
jgi:hypothetical protein